MPAERYDLAALRDALIGALRPFAEAAADLDEKDRDRDELWEHPAAMSITAGDLRRAAALIAQAEADHG